MIATAEKEVQKKEEEPATSKKEGGDEKENVGEELACANEGQAGRNKGLFFVLASIIVINFHVIESQLEQ